MSKKKVIRYMLQMKLVKVTPHATNYGGVSRESVWCSKRIELTNIWSEVNAMVSRLMEKINAQVIKPS